VHLTAVPPPPDYSQVHPYIRFAPTDPKIARLVEGLIRRLAFYVLYDPYANAFRIDLSYVFSEDEKLVGRSRPSPGFLICGRR
jgi:hypothetical protein